MFDVKLISLDVVTVYHNNSLAIIGIKENLSNNLSEDP